MARATAARRSRFRLAVLGAGQLGQTLVQGLLDAGVLRAADVTITAAHAERAHAPPHAGSACARRARTPRRSAAPTWCC